MKVFVLLVVYSILLQTKVTEKKVVIPPDNHVVSQTVEKHRKVLILPCVIDDTE